MQADLEALLGAQADRVIRGHGSPIGNIRAIGGCCVGPQAGAVERIHIDPRVARALLPDIGGSERTRKLLIVVKEDPVIPDVGQVIRAEEKLRRAPVLALRHRVGQVEVGRESAVGVRARELKSVNLAPRVIERGEDERLPEQAVIKLVLCTLVVAVEPQLKVSSDLLGDAGVEIVRTLGLHRVALAEGVRVFAVSIVVSIVLGSDDVASIFVIVCLTLFYTFEGGMRAVIWTDVVQMVLYVGGALVSFFLILHLIPGGWPHAIAEASAAHKFQLFDFRFSFSSEFFKRTYSFWGSFWEDAF